MPKEVQRGGDGGGVREGSSKPATGRGTSEHDVERGDANPIVV